MCCVNEYSLDYFYSLCVLLEKHEHQHEHEHENEAETLLRCSEIININFSCFLFFFCCKGRGFNKKHMIKCMIYEKIGKEN